LGNRGELPGAATRRRARRRRRAGALPRGEFNMNWPHAPTHWLFDPCIYIVTAGTYEKKHYLNSPEKLDYFMESLFKIANEFDWRLEAWSILSNHYHFIGRSPDDPKSLKRFIGKLHMTSAKKLNELDKVPGRKVWFQYWDRKITFEKSYLARLNYVHFNPAKHLVIQDASQYRWCSTTWFYANAPASFVKTVQSFKTDRISESDEY
jgi:putative transposase